MSGPAFTPTRELAAKAADKANDAYAMSRQVAARIDGFEETARTLDETVAAMLRRLIEAEDEISRLHEIVARLGSVPVLPVRRRSTRKETA